MIAAIDASEPLRIVTIFQESTAAAFGRQPHDTGSGGGLIQSPAA